MKVDLDVRCWENITGTYSVIVTLQTKGCTELQFCITVFVMNRRFEFSLCYLFSLQTKVKSKKKSRSLGDI